MRALPGTRPPFAVPAFLALLVSTLLCACSTEVVRESGTYADGSPAWEREYLRAPDGRRIPHGAHATWHPGGGPRRTLEFYDHGLRQGYAFEWDARGALVRLALCEDGVCADRPLPRTPSRAAAALARTRFLRTGLRVAAGP